MIGDGEGGIEETMGEGEANHTPYPSHTTSLPAELTEGRGSGIGNGLKL